MSEPATADEVVRRASEAAERRSSRASNGDASANGSAPAPTEPPASSTAALSAMANSRKLRASLLEREEISEELQAAQAQAEEGEGEEAASLQPVELSQPHLRKARTSIAISSNGLALTPPSPSSKDGAAAGGAGAFPAEGGSGMSQRGASSSTAVERRFSAAGGVSSGVDPQAAAAAASLISIRILLKQFKAAAMMGSLPSDERPEACGVLMWLADASGEPLGPIAEWPARRGVNPMWNSARLLTQTHATADGSPARLRIELWGNMEDGSRTLVAGPAIFAPEKVPMRETPISMHRSDPRAASRHFNPVPSATLLFKALAPIPPSLGLAFQRKTLFLIRHGESKWNAAKRHHNVYKLMKENDHPLNEAGYRQACILQKALRAALAAPPAEGAPLSAAQQMANAGAFWASPLTRALQTALVGLLPILEHGKTLELRANAREKKNFAGMDCIGLATGAKCFARALAELKGLDQSDGGPGRAELDALSRLSVDPGEVEEEWWTKGADAESDSSAEMRLDELLHQAEHCAADKIVMVGHSHFYREFFRRYLHPTYWHTDPLYSKLLQTKSIPNCSVVCCDVDFSFRPYVIQHVTEVTFGGGGGGKKDKKKDKHAAKHGAEGYGGSGKSTGKGKRPEGAMREASIPAASARDIADETRRSAPPQPRPAASKSVIGRFFGGGSKSSSRGASQSNEGLERSTSKMTSSQL